MSISFIVANPSGNKTAIVITYIDNSNYVNVANKIMNIKELGIEQVGFEKNPIGNSSALSRLEMMGGEFCGNAARSFGLYALKKERLSGEGYIEITGCDTPVLINGDDNTGIATANMPVPASIDDADCVQAGAVVVRFDGIYHLIIPNMEISETAVESLTNFMINHYPKVDAFGLMFLDTSSFFLHPVVYVKATDSLIYESSCGSGTMAVAYYLNYTKNKLDINHIDSLKNGIQMLQSILDDVQFEISQPGGIISTGFKNGKGYISGQVRFSEVIHI